MTKALEVENLTKEFKGLTAVDGISFAMEKGETVGLLGPNGAGKTTTIQMLLGVIKPDRGSIKIFNRDLEKKQSEILEKVNFSSTYISFPWRLTVRESLSVFAKLYNVKNWKEKANQLMAMLEIEHLKNKGFFKLSSGERTRVFLVKALLNDPALLLLDEPTASLDPDISEKIRKMILKIKKTRQNYYFIHLSQYGGGRGGLRQNNFLVKRKNCSSGNSQKSKRNSA